MANRYIPEKHREPLATALAAGIEDDGKLAELLGVKRSAARTYRRNMQLNNGAEPKWRRDTKQQKAGPKKSNTTNPTATPREDDYARAMAQHLNGSTEEPRSSRSASRRVFGERRQRYYPDTGNQPPPAPSHLRVLSHEEVLERLCAARGLSPRPA